MQSFFLVVSRLVRSRTCSRTGRVRIWFRASQPTSRRRAAGFELAGNEMYKFGLLAAWWSR